MTNRLVLLLATCMVLPACAQDMARPLAAASLTMPDGPSVAPPNGFVRMCETSPELCIAATSPVAVAAADTPEAAPAPAVRLAAAEPAGVPVEAEPARFLLASVFTVPVAPAFTLADLEIPPVPLVAAPAAASVPAPIDESALARLLRSVNRKVNGTVRQLTDAAIYGESELWLRSGVGRGAMGDCEDLAIEKREQLIAAGVPRERLFYATAYRTDLGLHTVLVARTARGDMVLDSRSPHIQHWGKVPYTWVSRQNPDAPMQWSMIVKPERGGVAVAARTVAPDVAQGDTAALK